MIERAITDNNLKSEYYLVNEYSAQSWEKFSLNNHGKIDGIVDSYIVEVHLIFERNERIISIEFKRQLTNTNK